MLTIADCAILCPTLKENKIEKSSLLARNICLSWKVVSMVDV